MNGSNLVFCRAITQQILRVVPPGDEGLKRGEDLRGNGAHRCPGGPNSGRGRSLWRVQRSSDQLRRRTHRSGVLRGWQPFKGTSSTFNIMDILGFTVVLCVVVATVSICLVIMSTISVRYVNKANGFVWKRNFHNTALYVWLSQKPVLVQTDFFFLSVM